MNGLEEIQKIINKFVYESKQEKQQIAEIEIKRTQLAQERNKKKNANIIEYEAEINVLGKQISELGNQSQGLQNKLDSKFNEIKKLVNLVIDNLITEEIRKVRKIDEERQELEEKVLLQKERNTKYEMQKQEFYKRFGRMPELSENAQKEDETQDRECLGYKNKIKEIEEVIENIEIRLGELVRIKRDFKNGNWSNIIDSENIEETTILPLVNEEIQVDEFGQVQDIKLEEFEPIEECKVEKIEPIEEIKIEKFEPIEEVVVEEFDPIDEMNVEEFQPLEELTVEEFDASEEIQVDGFETVEENTSEMLSIEEFADAQEQNKIDEIEELAKAIVEEIVAEQTKNLNIDKIEEQEIITFEENEMKEDKKTESSVIEKSVTLLNIIAKIEDGEVVYKAQISNGEEMKVYPAKLAVGNTLLKDAEIREEIKKVLINYAVAEYKALDKKVIKKIDPTVCEVLNKFAKKYNYDARNLIYNYAMSFSKKENVKTDVIPIIYNFSYIDSTNLSKKEKINISKIYKNARKNDKIDVIGCVTGLGKIRYMLKRIFATNNANALPEGKY